MSEKKLTLQDQIDAWMKDKEILDQNFFYFFDWFCKDESLKNKAQTLMPKVIRFAEIMNVDTRNSYVTFKNNCPMVGNLYDDFRICDLKTDDVIYTVTPKSGHTHQDFPAEVWGSANGFQGPIHQHKTWKELIGLLKTESLALS